MSFSKDNLYPKLSNVIDETRVTYNTLLEDIPVVENYQLSELDMQKYLVIANNHLTYLVDGLTVSKLLLLLLIISDA